MTVPQWCVRALSHIGFITVVLILCVTLNIGAGLLAPQHALDSAFKSGAITGRTPPEVSDWWHLAHAQADCRSIQPFLAESQQKISSGLSKPYFSDHGGKSTDCDLLGGVLAEPDNARIGHGTQATGLSAGGSAAILLIAAVGWKGAQIAHVVVIFGIWLTTFYLWRRKNLPVLRILPSTALTLMLLLFAVPGAVTMLPTSGLLMLLAAGPVARAEPAWWRRHAGQVSMASAALFWALDSQAASAPAGLALLLGILPICLGEDRLATLIKPILIYIRTSASIMILYFVATMLSGASGNLSLLKVLRQIFGDIPQAGPWWNEFSTACANLLDWVSAGIFHADTVVMMVFWTLPFAMLLGVGQRNDSSIGLRKFVSICVAAWLPLVPCIVWAVVYPGLLRRAPDSYVLLMVVPFAIGLTRIAISTKGIFNRRHVMTSDGVDADVLLARA